MTARLCSSPPSRLALSKNGGRIPLSSNTCALSATTALRMAAPATVEAGAMFCPRTASSTTASPAGQWLSSTKLQTSKSRFPPEWRAETDFEYSSEVMHTVVTPIFSARSATSTGTGLRPDTEWIKSRSPFLKQPAERLLPFHLRSQRDRHDLGRHSRKANTPPLTPKIPSSGHARFVISTRQ